MQAEENKKISLPFFGIPRLWPFIRPYRRILIINIILGIVLICNPFKAAIVLFRVLGVGLILSGVSDCFSTIYFARKLRRFKQEQDAVDSTFEEVDPDKQD